MSSITRRALTFALAAAGGAVFLLFGLPLPMLMGPMLACLLASLLRAPLQDAGILGTYMRTFIGVAVGASITPEVVAGLPDMAASLAFVPLFIVTIALIGYPLFRLVFGFDHPTAWYSAMPGGLQDMLTFGEEAGADIRALSLIHATRILIIITIAPMIMHAYWDVDLTRPPGVSILDSDPVEILLMALSGLIGWKVAQRLGLFGASIFGPMILTLILSLSGVIQHRPPAEIIMLTQCFIGIGVGIKYAGISLRELRVDVTAGIVYAIVLACISMVFFEIIVLLGLAPPLDAALAYLPGGQAEMVVIAIIAGADLAYVVSHHLLRVLIVILLAPIVEKIVSRHRK